MLRLSDAKLFLLIVVCSFWSMQGMETELATNEEMLYFFSSNPNQQSVANQYNQEFLSKNKEYLPILSETLVKAIPHFNDLFKDTGLPKNRQLFVPNAQVSDLKNFTTFFTLLHGHLEITKTKDNKKAAQTFLANTDTYTLVPLLNIANYLGLEEITSVGISEIIKNNDYTRQNSKLNPDLERTLATQLAHATKLIKTITQKYNDTKPPLEKIYLDHEYTSLMYRNQKKDIIYFDHETGIVLSAVYSSDKTLKTIILWSHKNFFGDYTHMVPTINSICWKAWTLIKDKPYISHNVQKYKIQSIDSVISSDDQTQFLIKTTTEDGFSPCFLLDVSKKTVKKVSDAKECFFGKNPKEVHVVSEFINGQDIPPKAFIIANKKGDFAAMFTNEMDPIINIKIYTINGVFNHKFPHFQDLVLDETGNTIYFVDHALKKPKSIITINEFSTQTGAVQCIKRIELDLQQISCTMKLGYKGTMLITDISNYGCVFYNTKTKETTEEARDPRETSSLPNEFSTKKERTLILLENGCRLKEEMLTEKAANNQAPILVAENMFDKDLHKLSIDSETNNLPAEFLEIMDASHAFSVPNKKIYLSVSDKLLKALHDRPHLKRVFSHTFDFVGKKWYQKCAHHLGKIVHPVSFFTTLMAILLALGTQGIYLPSKEVYLLLGIPCLLLATPQAFI